MNRAASLARFAEKPAALYASEFGGGSSSGGGGDGGSVGSHGLRVLPAPAQASRCGEVGVVR